VSSQAQTDIAMEEIDRLILFVQIPTGDEATVRLCEGYVRQLVALGEPARRRVAQVIDSEQVINLPALLGLMAAYRSPEAAEVLGRLLDTGPLNVAEAAADALASQPGPWAAGVLEQALGHRDLDVVAAVLAALRRVEPSPTCGAIVPLLRSPHRQVRFHASSLSRRARCLDAAALGELLDNERDPEIRQVLRESLQERAGGGHPSDAGPGLGGTTP